MLFFYAGYKNMQLILSTSYNVRLVLYIKRCSVSASAQWLDAPCTEFLLCPMSG